MNVDVPFRFDDHGRSATTPDDDHVRDMIEQLLLTSPGERVMRADFGGGLLAMPFEPTGADVASALELTLQAAVQRWLGDIVEVRRLEVGSEESTLRIVVEYAVRRTGDVGTATVRGPAA